MKVMPPSNIPVCRINKAHAAVAETNWALEAQSMVQALLVTLSLNLPVTQWLVFGIRWNMCLEVGRHA